MFIKKPEVYHGKKHDHDKMFFEGCYYKLVSSNKKYVFAVIAGAAFAKEKQSSHAFIQIYDGVKNRYDYHKFSIDDFFYSQTQPEIIIKDNYFTLNELKLNIDTDHTKIEGRLSLDHIHSWPARVLSPGAMGWFELVPFMECYYGILSFNNNIAGTLTVEDSSIDFTNGKGYIEKNWGKSFPESWIWIQCNHFKTYDVSLVMSVATIPFLFTTFPGFVIGFWYEGTLYRFCTYTGAKITTLKITELSKNEKEIFITVKDKNYELHVNAVKTGGYDLKAPQTGNMNGRCDESLISRVNLSFYRVRKNEKHLMFQENGEKAGVEVNGDMTKLYGKYNR